MAENNSNPQEVQLPDWVSQRLEKFDWEQIENELGVKKETVMKNERVATQLANGAMTDLVPCRIGSLYGEISMSPIFAGPDVPVKCKGYTKADPLSVNDRIFVYGNEINSETIKKALCEKTGWEVNGKRVGGYANSNAGCQVTLVVKQANAAPDAEPVKQKFLISLHEPTNRVVAMSVDAVRKFFINQDGEPIKYHTAKYGVELSPSDIELLIDGKRVFIVNNNKAGEMFSCWLQFDAAKRDVTVCHPVQFTQKETAQMNVKLEAYYKKDKKEPAKQQVAKEAKNEQTEKPKVARKVGKK